MAQLSTMERVAEAPVAPAGVRARRRLGLKPLLLGAAAVLVVAAAAQWGVRTWQVGRFMVGTDDAYVQADSTVIAPRISGTIAQVLVSDNQAVTPGQILARIDDRDFQTALLAAAADRMTAQAEIGSIDAQLQLQQSTIAQAASGVAAAQAALDFARQDRSRYGALARSGSGTIQLAQQTASVMQQRAAALQQAQAALVGAGQQVQVLQASRLRAAAQLEHAAAAEQQARLNLGYTRITAPIGGVVGARALRVGQYVQAGTQLMAVVPLHRVYVIANYKETQLTGVRPGQSVRIAVDTFPGETITGHVDSIAPATGLEFALLPPDNATGNFTKIVQRIPVRIAIDPAALAAGILRPGMSVEPEIDTRSPAPGHAS